MISVIIPSYNEEENIFEAAQAVSGVLADSEYELIFVDDGSTDGTWQKITEASADPHIRGLRFSRNFGKEPAIRAGLEAASGDAAVVMDCDLQHPPKVIPEMIKKWENGAKVVEGKKSARGSKGSSYSVFAAAFNSVMTRATGFDMSGASDFILLDREAVKAVLSYGESGSFFRALAQYVGFESEAVYYDVAERERGSGKWTFFKLLSYALKNIASFTSAPLLLGLASGAVVIAAAVVLFILKWCGADLGSFGAGVLALMLVGGLILISLGIIGYYLSRIYDEVKRRPKYIISADTKERK